VKILVINSGSSSIKYQLFDMDTQKPITAGLVERIGLDGSRIKHNILQGAKPREIMRNVDIKNHQRGLELVADLLMDEQDGVITSPSEIAAVGHRVVHGGDRFSHTIIITDEVKDQVRALIPFAPLHNPPNLEGIEVAEKIFTGTPQVAVFDTAFHQTMPAAAYRYALPKHLYTDHGIRSYGFHGTSHLYVTKAAADYLGKPLAEANFITAHLGNGASITAVKGGQSVDTSMGFSPLPGLIMGTRSGDIDPAIVYYLGTKVKMTLDEIDRLLNKQSGLLGLCGASDLRDIEARAEDNDADAKLALDMYTYRIKKYIGAYFATLGRVDALVFTAGVGENSPYVRWYSCSGLDSLGIRLDADSNNIESDQITEIQASDSRVKVLVIPTNEELEIAIQTREAISH
jgi:acetate kinase